MDISNATILVTGASGSLGKQIIYELHRRGIRPIAHVRETSNTSYIDSLGLERRTADLRVAAELARLVEGMDGIIHTAAWVNFRQDRLTQFTGINTMGALELFRAAQQAGVNRFVQLSSVAAVGARRREITSGRATDSNADLVTEESEFNLSRLRIPYIMTKRAAEEELFRQAAQGETELVIVNPSIVVAPSRTGDDRGKALKRLNRFVAPSIPNQLNLVDIRDVAPAVVAALERGRHGERYILAGDNISARDLILTVSSLLGRSPQLVRIPRTCLTLAARWSMIFARLSGRGKVSFYPDLVKLLDYDWVYSSLKARRELGYQSRSLHITLRDLLSNSFNDTYDRPGQDLSPGL